MIKGWLIKSGLTVILICILISGAEGQNAVWKQIDEGLHYGDFTAPLKASTGDSKILIIRIDPKLYGFRLLSASELASSPPSLNVKEWTDKYKLIAAINAGIFKTDLKSNVGYAKNYSHVNNPRFHKTYAAIFAFNPKKADLPPAMVFDTDVPKTQEGAMSPNITR